MYPINIRQMFKAAIVELNDEEKGIVKIKFNPWNKIKIPKADKTTQRGQRLPAVVDFRRGDILWLHIAQTSRQSKSANLLACGVVVNRHMS